MKKYVDEVLLKESIPPHYELKWTHTWNPTPLKSKWSITIYKDGNICEEELYLYMTYTTTLGEEEEKESSYIGTFTGTRTWQSNIAYKYYATIYKDSNKTEILCLDTLNPTMDKTNLLDLLYPVNSIYITSTNTNPESILGGTWELIKKEFKDAQGSSSSSLFTKNTTNTDTFSVYYRRAGNTLTIRLSIKTLVDAGDSSLTWGTLDLAALGASTLAPTTLTMIPRGAEAGLFIVSCTNAGKISSVDVRPKSNSGTTIAAGATFYFYENFNLRATDMIDSFCDKFYWKRVS